MKKFTDEITRLTVFNAKGGVGKTAIALNLALTYGYGIVTNDPSSIVNDVISDEQYIILDKTESIPKLPAEWPLIFDLAGYADARAKELCAGLNTS